MPRASENPRTVRVYVSGDVSFDMKKMEKVTANLMAKLGDYPAGHSGYDLRFIAVRDLVVNPKTLEARKMLVQGGPDTVR